MAKLEKTSSTIHTILFSRLCIRRGFCCWAMVLVLVAGATALAAASPFVRTVMHGNFTHYQLRLNGVHDLPAGAKYHAHQDKKQLNRHQNQGTFVLRGKTVEG
jgi:hypothetical protein